MGAPAVRRLQGVGRSGTCTSFGPGTNPVELLRSCLFFVFLDFLLTLKLSAARAKLDPLADLAATRIKFGQLFPGAPASTTGVAGWPARYRQPSLLSHMYFQSSEIGHVLLTTQEIRTHLKRILFLIHFEEFSVRPQPRCQSSNVRPSGNL